MKKKILIVTGIVLIFCCLFNVYKGCSKGVKASGEYEEIEEIDVSGEMTQEVEVPSLNAVSLKFDAYVEDVYSCLVRFTELSDNSIKTIVVKDEYEMADSIIGLKWINDIELAVEMHVNPSTNAVVVINAKENKIEYTKYGTNFEWIDNDSSQIVYTQAAPHFEATEGYQTIRNAQDKVLAVTEKDESIVDMALDENGEQIAYITEESGDYELIVGKLDDRIKKLSEKDATALSGDVQEIEWNDKCIICDDGEVEYVQ